MRIFLFLTCLANIAFAFGSLPWMPERVANHFDLNGVPNGFMSPIVNALLMSVTTGFMGAIFLGASYLMVFLAKHMPEFVNIPNRDYWLNEENRPKTVQRLCANVELMGVATMIFMLFLQWEIFRANQMVPPKLEGNSTWIGTGILLVVIAIDIWMLLSFRLPKSEPQSQDSAKLPGDCAC